MGPPGRIAVYCCLALHIAHGFVEAARKQYGDGEHDDGGLYKHSYVPSVWLIFSFTFPMNPLSETPLYLFPNDRNSPQRLVYAQTLDHFF